MKDLQPHRLVLFLHLLFFIIGHGEVLS
ncbi:MAG: hypothetical protein ACJAQT_002339 [Akkermansiaceae bacterium]